MFTDAKEDPGDSYPAGLRNSGFMVTNPMPGIREKSNRTRFASKITAENPKLKLKAPSFKSLEVGGAERKKENSIPFGILKQSTVYKKTGAKQPRPLTLRLSSKTSGRARQSTLIIARNAKDPRRTKIISKHRSSMFSFQPVPRRAQSSLNTISYDGGDEEDKEDEEDGDGEGDGDANFGEEKGKMINDSDIPRSDSTEKSDVKQASKSKLSKQKSSGVLYAVYEPEHKPIFINSMVIMCILVTLFELYYNGLDRTKENPCPVKFWKFCFESKKENPFFGPSAATLMSLGAKNGYSVVIDGQTHRLFTCMFLHGGLVHLSFNMVALCQMGLGIERSYGSGRVAIIYLISGLFGSITSTIFTPDHVGVGASGAIFGLFGAAWGDLIQNWSLYEGPQWTLMSLSFGTLFNLGIGTAPLLDNFAHFFGFVMGVMLSLGLLVVERQTSSGKHMKLSFLHVLLEFVPVILVPFSIAVSLGILYSGVSGHEVCGGCTKINCIPFPWGCNVHEEGTCVWDCNTCVSSGVTADATLYNNDATNATVTLHCPLLSDWTSLENVDIILKGEDVRVFDHAYLLGICKDNCPDAFL